ncbi:solute carrier family 23 protein [Salsuginibacillus kocurii]|uniref:solute carrier family 23 protein n=1 Tax=Salsuginibacillus kocurii TaxID=427078 RepID=UPI000377E5D4|nr:solute carrier family 23 protein [Salsuginibacillus kocurii]
MEKDNSKGKVQPHWKLGNYQLRLPFIHHRLEIPELIQGVVIFAIGLSMVEIMTGPLGISYAAAITIVIFGQFFMLIPPMLGVPFVPGFITPLIPVLIVFLGDYQPGTEALQALIALQLLVAFIFLIFGLTGLGRVFVTKLPISLKAGILIGAGITAIMTEIESGGRLYETPISLIAGGILCLYIMFSRSFRGLQAKSKGIRFIASYGIMPSIIIAIIIGWAIAEYPSPDIEWGITVPSLNEMWNVTPFVVGFPTWEIFLAAIPTAILAYIISYGDIIVGEKLIERSSKFRPDEKIEYDSNQLHMLTFFRNFCHALFFPHPGLAGPIFTAGTASVAERYTFGRSAMQSIFSGTNSLIISLSLVIFILPLVTLFQPFLPIALSITLILTGYLCITVGIQQLKNETEIGVAGVMGIVLAVHGAAYGLVVGLVLYLLLQKENLFSKDKSEEANQEEEKEAV